ncbi:polymer-forming cytoskeletal protein [uncultured Roseobacter sp.]|uniref:bactofilin family protein n=1 Tax=uncultured Roseobacter sp. TaxID=114847 RepID=UPI00260BC1EB|nr:polymer-forming cytoskeletal protein [uncultured Roseobacter sp.]
MANSIVEGELTIDGNIKSSDGNLEIKGSVVGDVTAAEVVIGSGGTVDGAVSAKTVVVEGRHKGSLKCDNVTFASTSNVQADVKAETMTTESGAKVVGKIDITGTG